LKNSPTPPIPKTVISEQLIKIHSDNIQSSNLFHSPLSEINSNLILQQFNSESNQVFENLNINQIYYPKRFTRLLSKRSILLAKNQRISHQLFINASKSRINEMDLQILYNNFKLDRKKFRLSEKKDSRKSWISFTEKLDTIEWDLFCV
jgi:flagellar biosynthesis chaperone FliJ